MDFLSEAIRLQPCTSKTCWNSQAAPPQLDPFVEQVVLVPATIGPDPLEARSSTFQHLFPSLVGSTCDDSENNLAIFKVNSCTSPPLQESTKFVIFDDNSHGDGGAEEASLATAQSYCSNGGSSMNAVPSEYSSQFTWSFVPPSPSPPHHVHSQAGAAELGRTADISSQELVCLYPADFLEPLDHHGHGSREGVRTLSKALPLMRQVPSLNRSQAGVKERSTKLASWPLTVTPPPTLSSLDNSWRTNIFNKLDHPLGSPCSVVSGPAPQRREGQRDSEYVVTNMATPGSGPSSTSAHGAVHGTQVQSGPGNGSQSISGSTHQQHQGMGEERGVHRRAFPGLKRKRSKAPKNSYEVESQRMTHIAVERNRRKQMNEHLAALRALMPGSYVHKGDQASIVGGAIEFVKELEHLLVCLQSQKRRRAYSELASPRSPTSRLTMPNPNSLASQHNQIVQAPFSFHNEQSTFAVGAGPVGSDQSQMGSVGSRAQGSSAMMVVVPGAVVSEVGVIGEARSEAASVEVRMVGAEQALVKVMAVRRSGQLLRTVVAMESLALTVVHANITTVNHTVLYSFQAQAGPRCRLTPHEIAAALHQTFSSLHSLQF